MFFGICRYCPGGYASGFSHVDHTIKPRLIHVKGKHCPRMREVWSSCGHLMVISCLHKLLVVSLIITH